MKITFAAIVDGGEIVGTRSSGSRAYTDVVLVKSNAAGDWAALSWHLSLNGAVKASDAKYVRTHYTAVQIVPAVPVKAQGKPNAGGPYADIWVPLYEAACAYAANAIDSKRDTALAEITADAEPVDVEVIEPVMTITADGDPAPVDGLRRPIVKATREAMVACAAVGLSYWSDHPTAGHVWAVDAHQTAHPVRIDRKHGLVAVGERHNLANRLGNPVSDDVISWSVDGPADADGSVTLADVMDAAGDRVIVGHIGPPVESLSAPRLGNLESVNRAITAAETAAQAVTAGHD